MIVWLKKSDGDCIRLVDEWKPRIHVCGEFRDLLDLSCKPYMASCNFVEKFERAGDQDRSRSLEVAVNNDREATSLANRIQKEGKYSKFRLYDVDIPSVQMYLYHKDLFPLALVEVQENHRGVCWTLKDSRESIDYNLPPFQKVRLQLRTHLKKKVQSLDDKLDIIQIVRDNGETIILDSGDESEKILGLVETFRETDPDIVLTEAGDSFIFPFLAKKAEENGILDKLILGREESPLRVYEVQGHSYFSYGKILYRETAARLLGRLHIDESNAFITNDCDLDGLFEVSRTCIIPIQRASRATIGTNMTSLQLYNAVKEGVLIPWNKNAAEERKDASELVEADRGGFVYEPTVGVHDEIGELDFSSLYPAIMLRENLSGETVKCQCCLTSANRVPELGYNICQRLQGIIPRSLEILLRKRALFKSYKREGTGSLGKDTLDNRQAALKWILVCSFGYLGFKNARFGKVDAHIATCAFARVALRRAVAIAESRGFELANGIVDSMWLRKQGAEAEEYLELCDEMKKDLGLPISFEGQYKWVVFLTSKIDTRIPVLNRYFGMFQDGTPRVRGIELRRHDTPRIVNECQNEMLAVLYRAENSRQFKTQVPEALEVVKKKLSLLRSGEVEWKNLVIRKNLSKDPNKYANRIPQALAAQESAREGKTVHAGQLVNYILARKGQGSSQPRAIPVELMDDDVEYDSGEYEKLLLSSAKNILLPFGYDDQAIGEYLGLEPVRA